ncbi:hypothetical protein [Neisseria gonorrhoeae]|uniref:hypothetical protein n=1 Tax=Neisseria gonorrhoeae TaxID=485 RepID=UPI00309D4C18
MPNMKDAIAACQAVKKRKPGQIGINGKRIEDMEYEVFNKRPSKKRSAKQWSLQTYKGGWKHWHLQPPRKKAESGNPDSAALF